MNTWQRIMNRLKQEWSMAGSLGRLAMVAAPLLLMATMLLGSIVAAGYYEYATFGIPDDALIVPTAALPQARPFGVYTVANGRAIMAWSVSK